MAYKSWSSGDILYAADLNSSLDSAGWTAYTPTLTSLSVGTGGTISARYTQVGKLIVISGTITLGTSPSVTGIPIISLPTGKTFKGYSWIEGTGSFYNGSLYSLHIPGNTSSSVAVYLLNTAGTYAQAVTPNGAFTYASGNIFAFKLIYETA